MFLHLQVLYTSGEDEAYVCLPNLLAGGLPAGLALAADKRAQHTRATQKSTTHARHTKRDLWRYTRDITAAIEWHAAPRRAPPHSIASFISLACVSLHKSLFVWGNISKHIFINLFCFQRKSTGISLWISFCFEENQQASVCKSLFGLEKISRHLFVSLFLFWRKSTGITLQISFVFEENQAGIAL